MDHEESLREGKVIAKNLQVAPANVGPVSYPEGYRKVANQAIYDIGDGVKVFAGPRDDPFFADLGGIFDLLQGIEGEDYLADLNVHTVAIQVPTEMLTKGNRTTIGVRSTSYRQSMSVLRPIGQPGSQNNNPSSSSGPWVQLSRLDMPLVNELAVVAAYLIGARGTARHAGILGLTVTLTHTAGVFVLGAVTLYLSRYILPEVLYPWLSAASGLLVVLIGLVLLYRNLDKMTHDRKAGHTLVEHTHSHEGERSHAHHTHSHDGYTHGHLPADGSKITWHGLMALGVSGGLVPCPAALVLLLGAISLDRLGFGMVLVLAFSAGLADR